MNSNESNPFTKINEQLEAINQRLETRHDSSFFSEWLTVDQAAAYLHVSKSWIYKRTMDGNGKIPFHKIGKKLAFRQSELDDFISMGRAKGESLPGVRIEKLYQ